MGSLPRQRVASLFGRSSIVSPSRRRISSEESNVTGQNLPTMVSPYPLYLLRGHIFV